MTRPQDTVNPGPKKKYGIYLTLTILLGTLLCMGSAIAITLMTYMVTEIVWGLWIPLLITGIFFASITYNCVGICVAFMQYLNLTRHGGTKDSGVRLDPEEARHAALLDAIGEEYYSGFEGVTDENVNE